jgi:hypothetical protein
MFGLFRKKTIVNEVFGAVKLYADKWSASTNLGLLLWNKEYKLHISIVDNSGSGINQLQEETFVQFKNNIEMHQKDIEQIVASYFNMTDASDLIARFVPYELLLNTNGECVIIGENNDDEDTHDVLPGLAVVIYPKLAIFTGDAYSRYAFFDVEDDVKNELYGAN